MKRSWSIWLGATVFGTLYIWLGFLASWTEGIDLKLEPGYATQVSLFRIAEDNLRMTLVFQGNHARRPELGNPATKSDWRKTGLVTFDDPGSAVRIIASMPDGVAVPYEAFPISAHSSTFINRNLQPGAPVSPGVWQWPPTTKGLVLHSGTNIVHIQVVAVEEPIVGENVHLSISPALGFKSSAPNVAWLWPSLLMRPLFIAFLALWAGVLIVMGLLRWRGN